MKSVPQNSSICYSSIPAFTIRHSDHRIFYPFSFQPWLLTLIVSVLLTPYSSLFTIITFQSSQLITFQHWAPSLQLFTSSQPPSFFASILSPFAFPLLPLIWLLQHSIPIFSSQYLIFKMRPLSFPIYFSRFHALSSQLSCFQPQTSICEASAFLL